MAQSSSSTGLLHLPNELLCQIFDNSDTPTSLLYILAQVCRRLHHLFIPICLNRHSINDPTAYTKLTINGVPTYGDALSTLEVASIAGHVTRIDGKLICKFPVPSGEDIRVVTQSVRRLHKFVGRMLTLGNVELVFRGDRCCCCSGFPEEVLKEWSECIGDLLSCILEKSCSELTVRGGRLMAHVYAFRCGKRVGSKSSPSLFSGSLRGLWRCVGPTHAGKGKKEEMNRVLRGKNWEFCRVKGAKTIVLTELSPAAREKSALRALTIMSTMFFIPPILHWTVAALQHSAIESLTLSNLSINKRCWLAIFKLIADAIPHLAELNLSRLKRIKPVDLIWFLARFPQLSSLSLGRDVEMLDDYELGSFPDFPALISLYAPSHWVFKLLSSQRMGLACLENLFISYNLKNEGFSHWFRHSKSASIPSLLGEQCRPLTLSLEVLLGDSPGWKMFDDLSAPPNQPNLDTISSLALIVEQEFRQGDMDLWGVLPRWLSLFPGLKDVSFKGHNKAIDGAEGTLIEKVVAVVKKSGLSISSVEVNGVEVELEVDAEPQAFSTLEKQAED